MVQIPPIAYILVGASVSAFSWFVESRSSTASLTLFFYAGIIFILTGFAKMALGYGKQDNTKPASHHSHQAAHRDATPQRHHPHHLRMQEVKGQHNISNNSHSTQQHAIIICPRCSARHYAFARFCMSCGWQLRSN